MEDVWLARTIIEPPAAGLMAAQRNASAFAALDANIAAAREVAQSDPIRYADLSAQFSVLITQNCGNKTIQLLSALIYDIIRKQHEQITERTLAKAGVDKLRQDSIRRRIEVVELMRNSTPAALETFWRAYLLHMRHLVMSAYKTPMTIEVLNGPVGKFRPVGKVKGADS